MEPKAAPGTPWEGEISLGNFSGGPPEDSIEFFGTADASREPPGKAPGAHLAPKRVPEAFGSEFGTQIGAKMEPPGLIFGAIFASFGKLFSDTSGFSSRRLLASSSLRFRAPGQGETTQKRNTRNADTGTQHVTHLFLDTWPGGMRGAIEIKKI